MADSEMFWQGAESGVLVIQRCRSCGRSQHFPRARCHFCLGEDREGRTSSGHGTLLTFSTVHRPPSPEFADLVPYTLGIVRLDEENVQVMARILEAEDDLELDLPVTVDFTASPLGPIMPAFRRREPSE